MLLGNANGHTSYWVRNLSEVFWFNLASLRLPACSKIPQCPASCCLSRYELPHFANILWGKDISIFCTSTLHTQAQTVLSGCRKKVKSGGWSSGAEVVRCAVPPCKEVRRLPLTCAICTTGPRGTFVRREGQWQRTIDPPPPCQCVHTIIIIHTLGKLTIWGQPFPTFVCFRPSLTVDTIWTTDDAPI